MKKIIFAVLIVICTSLAYAQNYFPHHVQLRDTSWNRVPSITLNNFKKPLILEFFGTHCKPCISLLDSFKEVHKEWSHTYGAKIVVIVTDKKSKRKKLLKMIKAHKWPFQFYFDPDKKLFDKVAGFKVLPQTIIYDGNYNVRGSFIGVKSNIGYKLINGKPSNEKVIINRGGKYGHLECDLTEYEQTLNLILNNSN